MTRFGAAAFLLFAALLLGGCAPGNEASTNGPAESEQQLYRAGHALYVAQHYDSAATILKRAAALDSAFVEPRRDLANLYYNLGMQVPGEKSPKRQEYLRRSQGYLAAIEALGETDSDTYERLCELSDAIGDSRSFLKYAKRNVEHYPYDRQYYNLGVAYFSAGEYGNVVKSQKEAMDKFSQSPFIGGFYRQAGRAYAKMDRDQTAERMFESGVKAVDAQLAQLKRASPAPGLTADSRRLLDDKIGMLVELRRLHRTYQETQKLEQVERQLKEAGYNK